MTAASFTSSLRQLSIGLVLMIASLVLALVMGEIVVRILLPLPPGLSWMRADGVTVHSPGARAVYARQEFCTKLSFNRDGLRGPEIERPKPPGTLRILVLGDSYVEGVQVPWEDLLTTRLATLLNSDPGPRVEVINAGVSGYGTSDELRLLDAMGWNFSPDFVLLCFCVHNDLSDNERRPLFDFSVSPPIRHEPAPPTKAGLKFLRTKEFLAGHSQLYQFFRDRIAGMPGLDRTVRKLGLRRPAARPALPNEERITQNGIEWFRDPMPANMSNALDLTRNLLSVLSQDAARHGVPLVVAWIPLRSQVEDRRWADLSKAGIDTTGMRARPQVLLTGMADDLGIAPVDLLPAFLAQSGGPPLYFDIDGHWTAQGHRVAAETLAPILRAWRLGKDVAHAAGAS